MTFAVAQRTREIGIRTALGATRVSIVSSVGRKAALQLGLGSLFGCALAIPVMLAVAGEPLIRPHSPVLVVLGVTAGLVSLGFLACAAPALRAARVQPTEALREG